MDDKDGRFPLAEMSRGNAIITRLLFVLAFASLVLGGWGVYI